MSLWVIPVFLLFYFIIPFVITRIRTEGGIYVHSYNAQSPRYMMSEILGRQHLGPQNLTILAISFYNYTFRATQMPHQLEAFRIANQAKISKRPLILAILLTTVISLLVSFLIEVNMYYKIGANSGYFGSFALLGDHYFGWLHNSLVYATTQDNMSILFTGIGLLSSIFIAAMRARFIWWPFHPLGLIMAGNDEMEDLWLPIFLCWVLKRLVLKHGGHRAYRRAIPFFLGLALGDFALGSMWSILSILFNHRMYQYFP